MNKENETPDQILAGIPEHAYTEPAFRPRERVRLEACTDRHRGRITPGMVGTVTEWFARERILCVDWDGSGWQGQLALGGGDRVSRVIIPDPQLPGVTRVCAAREGGVDAWHADGTWTHFDALDAARDAAGDWSLEVTESPYPEHDAQHKILGRVQGFLEIVDWLEENTALRLVRMVESGAGEPWSLDYLDAGSGKLTREALARFFRIDLAALEEERLRMIAALREANER